MKKCVVGALLLAAVAVVSLALGASARRGVLTPAQQMVLRRASSLSFLEAASEAEATCVPYVVAEKSNECSKEGPCCKTPQGCTMKCPHADGVCCEGSATCCPAGSECVARGSDMKCRAKNGGDGDDDDDDDDDSGEGSSEESGSEEGESGSSSDEVAGQSGGEDDDEGSAGEGAGSDGSGSDGEDQGDDHDDFGSNDDTAEGAEAEESEPEDGDAGGEGSAEDAAAQDAAPATQKEAAPQRINIVSHVIIVTHKKKDAAKPGAAAPAVPSVVAPK